MAHISVSCPQCESRYQVEPDLRGKLMRCPNPLCRFIFEVRDDALETERIVPPPAEPLPVPRNQVSGTVGEILPILPVEATPAPDLDDWLSTPDGNGEPAPQTLQEMGSGTWTAPPVRSRGQGTAHETAPASEAVSPGVGGSLTAEKTRSRARWLIAALSIFLAIGLGAGLWIAHGKRQSNETDRFQSARELYENHAFSEASAAFQNLNRDFPESDHVSLYRFLGELSEVRDSVYAQEDSPKTLEETLQHVVQFLEFHRNDPLLSSYESDIWQTLQRLTQELADAAERKKDRILFKCAHQSLGEAKNFRHAGGAGALKTIREIEATLQNARTQIDAIERRQDMLDRIRQLAKHPSADSVQLTRRLVREAGLETDATFQDLLRKLVEGHAAAVRFTPVHGESEQSTPELDTPTTLIVAPYLSGSRRVRGEKRAIVFGLVGGVLYALDAHSGEHVWARRVGVDTDALPVRLPETAYSPEIALIPSSDRRTISAVEIQTGRSVWEHVLSDLACGQPLVIGHRILVCQSSGRVDELELASGHLRGFYNLGQALTVGGTRQEGSGLVYIPADSFAVYVIDAVQRRCVAVLYSGHPAGSLRSPPVIVWQRGRLSQSEEGGFLVLPQAEGLDAVKLRAFQLPIKHPDQPALHPEWTVSGWPWFPPHQDGERLALVTDTGTLGLFGIGQIGNRDPFLFPLLKQQVRLVSTPGPHHGRAQLVRMDADNFWTLAQGRLQRLQLTFTPQDGPIVLERWPEQLLLGSPLHAAQVHDDISGHASLILVTRLPGQVTCVATAIDAGNGHTIWQRQLGMTCQDHPFQMADKVLVRDANGVLAFQVGQVQSWQTSGSRLFSFTPEESGANVLMLPGPQSTFVLSITDSTLKVRRYRSVPDSEVTVRSYSLPASVAGTPALAGDILVLPLSNGILLRLPLENGAAAQGANWRSPGADEHAVGHVLALDGDNFLVSDGNRGLQIIHWPEPNSWEKKAEFSLPRRITVSPALVPVSPGKNGSQARLVVADASGTLSLLDAGNLTLIRRWKLPGQLSSGPFVRPAGIGCIVDRKRLVWFTPDKDEYLWEYQSIEAEIVGQPVEANGRLILATMAGSFLALDPATGRTLGAGYTVMANAAPAAAPVPFGSDRLFAPLTDGTILLLDMSRFQ
jgi:outer membrane protein assembly factor BamB